MRAYEPLVRRIFNQLDTVADGKLTFKELRQGYRNKEVRWDLLGLDANQVKKTILKEADLNDDRVLDFDEFYKFVVERGETYGLHFKKSPEALAEEYLSQHNLNRLMEHCVAALLVAKPESPEDFLTKRLELLQKALLEHKDGDHMHDFTEPELEAMFYMFDKTRSGEVTAEQVNNAIFNVSGAKGEFGVGEGMYDPKMPVNMPDFKERMRQAMFDNSVPDVHSLEMP